MCMLKGFTGRLNRTQWWYRIVGILVLIAALVLLAITSLDSAFRGNGTVAGLLVALVGLLIPIYMFSSATVRRLHDLGKSAWWFGAFVLLQALPVLIFQIGLSPSSGFMVAMIWAYSGIALISQVGFIFLVGFCGFAQGQEGINRYGPAQA